MNFDDLKIYECNFKKIRLGKKNDGGYIILDIDDYDAFISCGIERDISFDEAFIKKYQNIKKILAYDGTIRRLPKKNNRIKFVRRNIGPEETRRTSNLHNILENYKNVFLKMDIEGSEFEWINSLSANHLINIKQLVIEIHYPFSKEKWNIFSKLNKTHYLCHIHGNNCRKNRIRNQINVGTSDTKIKKIETNLSINKKIYFDKSFGQFKYKIINNILEIERIDGNKWDKELIIYFDYPKPIYVPDVFEATYINKKFVNNPKLNTKSFPIKIEQPNNKYRKQHIFNSYPYIN